METNKVYICRTPYHVVLAHLIAEHTANLDSSSLNKNYCILAGHAMSRDTATLLDMRYWHKITHFDVGKSLRYKYVLRKVDEWINSNLSLCRSVEREVLLGDDKNWRVQLLITGLAAQHIALFEDGFGSYVRQQPQWHEKFYQRWILKTILGKRLLHTGPVSNTAAQTYYALSNTAFSWRANNTPLTVIDPGCSKYLANLGQSPEMKDLAHQLESSDWVVLTQPLSESGYMPLRDELALYREIARSMRGARAIVLKKHPRENDDRSAQRLQAFRDIIKVGSIQQTASPLPVDFVLACMKETPKVVGVSSTALANIKRLRPELEVFHASDLVGGAALVSAFFEQLGVRPISEIGQ